MAHGVQAALGRCERASRTPPQWLPTPRWAVALTALAGNFLFHRWACGQRKRLKWRQAARAASSPASLSRSGTGTITSWFPTCISRPMCSAEVPSLGHGIMRAASNTQWRCIERCQRATALRSTVGRRLAGDHLMLQDMPFGSCPLARMPCLHTHRSMCLSCVRCAHTLKK